MHKLSSCKNNEKGVLSYDMSAFKIQQQREAEKDEYLIECFHDAGFIDSLINSSYSIICGRKGTGKTAIARYMEDRGSDFGIDLSLRISIRSISLGLEERLKDHVNSILFFIIIKSIQKFLEENIFDDKAKGHWKNFLLQNGLQAISDYETFFESKKENKSGFSLRGLLNSVIAKVGSEVSAEDKTTFSRTEISNTPSSLIEALRQSLPGGRDLFIFLDDITDYLDLADDGMIKKEIAIIQDLLLALENYNLVFSNSGKGLRFISLVREDLFEYMEGSNINKLRGDAMSLEWNEESFASLLIRRLPFYQDNLHKSLQNPKESIRKLFPDEIFSEVLNDFQTLLCVHGRNFV